MSGYTVVRTEVIKTNLIKVECDICAGKCYLAGDDQGNVVYKCSECGVEHPNPNQDNFPAIEYIT